MIDDPYLVIVANRNGDWLEPNGYGTQVQEQARSNAKNFDPIVRGIQCI